VLFGVDRFELAAVNSDKFTREEVELFAQHRALPANLAQRLQVVLPEVRNRLGLWSQLLSEPHQLHMPVRRLSQATTRPETVEIAIHIELQQIRWMVGRPSRGCGCGSLTAERREVEVVDKGVDETDEILFSHIVVEPLWEQDRFVAVYAVDKAHAGTTLRESKEVSHCR
jgi:hypothetical protein